jgi:predicted Rossmann fold nucleotide-binding protein DprA/Smf involved in DNA uptake
MTQLQNQLKAVSAELAKLAKELNKVATQVSRQEKVAAKKTAAKPVKKAAPKKPAAAKKSKKSAPKKAAVAKKAAAPKKPTVLDAVLDVVRRARKGATIATLKEKTGLSPRQLSNALYKLSTRGKIAAKARGVYVKK